MTVLLWISLGLLIIGAGIVLAAAVVTAVTRGVRALSNGFIRYFLYGTNRQFAKSVALIPPELLPTTSPLPAHDFERERLLKYHPRAETIKPPRDFQYIPRLIDLFPGRMRPSKDVDIDELGKLLLMSKKPPYEYALESIAETDPYPIKAPTKPDDIPPPPSWSPWDMHFGEPEFAPPLWNKPFLFLNKYVLDAHKEELRAVEFARAKRDSLLKQIEARNHEVAKLAAEANQAYVEAKEESDAAFLEADRIFRESRQSYKQAMHDEGVALRYLNKTLQARGSSGLLARIDLAMKAMSLQKFVATECATSFNADSGIVIHEHRFPDPTGLKWLKYVELKSGQTVKPATKREQAEAAARLFPMLCIRLAAEIARLDDEGIVKAVVVNGWAKYTEKATGQKKQAYCASLFATKEQISALNLAALDPAEAFAA